MSDLVDHGMIDIVLATFNGARYLPAMLDSIGAQSHPHWRLVVRDDSSDDATVSTIEAFERRFPGKVVLVKDSLGRLGAVRNFEAAAKMSSARYLAFADQDDIWLPDKLEVTLQRMRELESEHGSHVPLLVHTDLRVVDEALNEIAASFTRSMRLNPVEGGRLRRLLARNVVTGCTTLSNRPLVDLALPMPADAVLHDWWFALVAACFGVVDFVDRQTVLYRQHASNVIGAGNAWSVRKRGGMSGMRAAVRRRYGQANALLEQFATRLTPKSRATLARFARMRRQGLPGRAWQTVSGGYFDHGIVRTLAALLLK